MNRPVSDTEVSCSLKRFRPKRFDLKWFNLMSLTLLNDLLADSQVKIFADQSVHRQFARRPCQNLAPGAPD